MPAKRKKKIRFNTIDDLPEAGITADMIANSYLGISAQYVRNGIRNGQYKGYQVGRTCYMSREQVRQNWG
jgi:uncharacterized protein YggE